MDRKLLTALLVAVFSVWTPGLRAQEESPANNGDLRSEIRDLKQLMFDISDRLDALEERLSRLEQQRPSSPTTTSLQVPGRRPLGNYTVDENGIIWDRGYPVGFWGVWGRQAAQPALRPGKSSGNLR